MKRREDYGGDPRAMKRRRTSSNAATNIPRNENEGGWQNRPGVVITKTYYGVVSMGSTKSPERIVRLPCSETKEMLNKDLYKLAIYVLLYSRDGKDVQFAWLANELRKLSGGGCPLPGGLREQLSSSQDYVVRNGRKGLARRGDSDIFLSWRGKPLPLHTREIRDLYSVDIEQLEDEIVKNSDVSQRISALYSYAVVNFLAKSGNYVEIFIMLNKFGPCPIPGGLRNYLLHDKMFVCRARKRDENRHCTMVRLRRRGANGDISVDRMKQIEIAQLREAEMERQNEILQEKRRAPHHPHSHTSPHHPHAHHSHPSSHHHSFNRVSHPHSPNYQQARYLGQHPAHRRIAGQSPMGARNSSIRVTVPQYPFSSSSKSPYRTVHRVPNYSSPSGKQSTPTGHEDYTPFTQTPTSTNSHNTPDRYVRTVTCMERNESSMQGGGDLRDVSPRSYSENENSIIALRSKRSESTTEEQQEEEEEKGEENNVDEEDYDSVEGEDFVFGFLPSHERTCVPLSKFKAGIFEGNFAFNCNVHDDGLPALLHVLPRELREAIEKVEGRDEEEYVETEVVVDLGRDPFVRYANGTERRFAIAVDINEAVQRLRVAREQSTSQQGGRRGGRGGRGGRGRRKGGKLFSEEGRVGLNGTLHRISAIRGLQNNGNNNSHYSSSSSENILGLTYRVGRHIAGVATLIRDLVARVVPPSKREQDGPIQNFILPRSLLLVGPPSSGKTTLLRDITRMLADEMGKRVLVVDTSMEIGGDGEVPHPAIGKSRRIPVPNRKKQFELMLEAVQNHNPQVIVVDEIGSLAEAKAVASIAQRGVAVVATAHGMTLQNIMHNPELNILVGGVKSVILSATEVQERNRGGIAGKKKSKSERQAPPTFPVLVELHGWTDWLIHRNVGRSVDVLLEGGSAKIERRRVTSEGLMVATPVRECFKTILAI